jgi:hypothetical protein
MLTNKIDKCLTSQTISFVVARDRNGSFNQYFFRFYSMVKPAADATLCALSALPFRISPK